MNVNLEILAIIPARGGSKGIARKNIKLLDGRPLLSYTAEAALKSKLLNRIVLSTEDKEIARIGESFGLEVPYFRPGNLAADDSPSLPVFQDMLRHLEIRDNYKPTHVVILQPTSPFRNEVNIDEAIELFLNEGADSLVSVVEVPHNMIPQSIMEITEQGFLTPYMKYDETKNSRQLKPKFYARNGAAIYIVTYECLMVKGSLFGDRLLPYFMDKISSIDIDDMQDWCIAETVVMNKGP